MSTSKGTTLTDNLTQLTTYDQGELDDPVSLIEPLSADSLAALDRLARYKPPPDPYPFPAGRSAVLVALFGSRTGRNLNVLLSTRSPSLRTYVRSVPSSLTEEKRLITRFSSPGKARTVALPGGKMDDTDMNLEATARREAFEEIGLPIDTTRIRYLTALPPFLARSMMLITPIVCFVLDYSLRPELNPSEVSTLFSFPLEGFLTSFPDHPIFRDSRLPSSVLAGETPYHRMEDYPWYDGRPQRFHAFEARPQAVEGLTAQMLIHVAQIAYGRPPDFPLYAPNELRQDELIQRAMQDPKWHDFRRNWVQKRREEGEEEKAKL